MERDARANITLLDRVTVYLNTRLAHRAPGARQGGCIQRSANATAQTSVLDRDQGPSGTMPAPKARHGLVEGPKWVISLASSTSTRDSTCSLRLQVHS